MDLLTRLQKFQDYLKKGKDKSIDTRAESEELKQVYIETSNYYEFAYSFFPFKDLEQELIQRINRYHLKLKKDYESTPSNSYQRNAAHNILLTYEELFKSEIPKKQKVLTVPDKD